MQKIRELLSKIEDKLDSDLVYIIYFSDGSGILFDDKDVIPKELTGFEADCDIENEIENYLESLNDNT